MKKLSILTASLLCLTVGGVYAAWQYAEKDVAPVSTDKGIQLESYVDAEAPGVYTLTPEVNSENTVNSTDLFYFDSYQSVGHEDAADNPHGVAFVTNCSLTITFKASDYATEEIRTKGLATTVSFQLSVGDDIDAYEYKDIAIFTDFAGTQLTILPVDSTAGENEGVWTYDSTNDIFTYEITRQDLNTLLGVQINPNLKLENSTEHKGFDEYITGLTIKTTVAKKA